MAELTAEELMLAEEFKEYCEKKYAGSFRCVMENLVQKSRKDEAKKQRKGNRKLFAKH